MSEIGRWDLTWRLKFNSPHCTDLTMKPVTNRLCASELCRCHRSKGCILSVPVCLFNDASPTAQQVDPVGTGICRDGPSLYLGTVLSYT